MKLDGCSDLFLTPTHIIAFQLTKICTCQNDFSKSPPKVLTLSLHTAWTSFDPFNIECSASFSQWKVASARSFILSNGIVTDTMSATPPEPRWCAVHSTP